jgi:hypothetical protein
MPSYLIEENAVAKFLTDEERKERGFCKGNCIDASMDTWKELTNKFGNHFDIVYIIMDRTTTTITRIMNEEQKKEFLGHGKYQGHFVVFNRKTRMYIDKSNGQSIMVGEKQYLSSFNDKKNKYVGVYHFGIDFMFHLHTDTNASGGVNITKWKKNQIGEFMCSMLRNYENRLPTKNEEIRWRKKGMRVIKSYQ